MTTGELITRAQHAICTGQPNLAQLYMRKALQQTDQQRRALNPLAWQIRQMSEAFQRATQAFAGIGIALTSLANGIKRAVAAEEEYRKHHYTLGGPGK